MIPGKQTKLGRVLRTMADGKLRTAAQVRRDARMHPEAEVTARIRDLRKIGCAVSCICTRMPDGKAVYRYQLAFMPSRIRLALDQEKQGVAA